MDFKEDRLDRRAFLKISGLTALAAGLTLSLRRRYLQKGWLGSYSETRYLMGTAVNIQLTAGHDRRAREVVREAFAEMERLVGIFDHRRPSSPLAELNHQGILEPVPIEMQSVLEEALQIGEESKGALDITIKPALDVYRQRLTVPDSIKEVVDYRALHLDGPRAVFQRPGMGITLDAIAKGWIVDQVAGLLTQRGVVHTLVEAGGDLLACGGKGPSRPWRIGIRHPRHELSAVVELRGGAVATSGDYLHTYHEGYLHHHILDPGRGISPRELASVTVCTDRASAADAWSTAVMVLGLEPGLALIEKLPETEALLVTKTLDVHLSSNFPGSLVI